MQIRLEALLSQNVSLLPQGSHTRDPADFAWLGERSITFCLQSLSTGRKKNSNNKYQSKGFLPFEGQEGEQPDEGWTCRKLSRDPDPAGLKHKHFPDELSQQQNDALGARIALKFKSGC